MKRTLNAAIYRSPATLFMVLSALTGVATAQNTPPLINQPLVPGATAPGEAEFALTVNGTAFVSGAVVNWNASSLATTFASGVGTSAGRTIAVRAWRWEQALQEEINLGLLLPCNAVVYERAARFLSEWWMP